MRRVAVLLGLGEKDLEAQKRAKAFRLGMRDLGWIEGRNIQVDYRFTDSSVDSIKKNVAEVVTLAPDVIIANSTPIIAALRPTTALFQSYWQWCLIRSVKDSFQTLHAQGATSPDSNSSISK